MLAKPFLLALAFRSLSLLLPQTYFQPDEYWQSLEVAHEHVFGYGFLTWEWRDLPEGGRLRGWIWPGVFVIIYRFLQVTGLDQTRLIVRRLLDVGADVKVLMPRMVGVVVAAVTDWATYRLSSKLLGSGSAAGAVSFPCWWGDLAHNPDVPVSYESVACPCPYSFPVQLARDDVDYSRSRILSSTSTQSSK